MYWSSIDSKLPHTNQHTLPSKPQPGECNRLHLRWTEEGHSTIDEAGEGIMKKKKEREDSGKHFLAPSTCGTPAIKTKGCSREELGVR